jgi:hypothetical protein
MVDAVTVDFDLPLGVIGPIRRDHPIIAGIEPARYVRAWSETRWRCCTAMARWLPSSHA